MINKNSKMNFAENRKSRSYAILDEEDVGILFSLMLYDKINKKLYLTDLEKKMKISRKSILNHLNKLEKFEWIKLIRSDVKEEYKQKIVLITSLGQELICFLFKSKVLINGKDEEIFINLNGIAYSIVETAESISNEQKGKTDKIVEETIKKFDKKLKTNS